MRIPVFPSILLAVLLACCTEKPVQQAPPKPEWKNVTLEASLVTKAYISSQGVVSWKSGDHIAIISDGQCYDFASKSIGFGGKTATFSGKVISNPDRTTFYALHPYSGKYLPDGSGMKGALLEIQREQDQNNTSDRIILAGTASADGDDFSGTGIQMREITLFWDIAVNNPSGKAVSSVSLTASKPVFPVSAGLDLSREDPAISVKESSESISASFRSPCSDNSFTVRFILLPVSNVGEAVEITVTFQNGDREIFKTFVPAGCAMSGGRCSDTITIGDGKPYDPVEEGDYYAAPFQGVPDIDHMKIYEASPRIFSKTNSLRAVKARLDKISELGANVLWLMPIFDQSVVRKPFGSPYSMKDFYSISEEYGTLDDLRDLVAEAHSKGIAVILDFITNHTGADCEWVSSHPSWYMEEYAPSYTDAALFNWNTSDPTFAKQILHAMDYWIHVANIDGYRFDTVTPTREGGVTLDFFSSALPELRRRNPDRKLILLAESARAEVLGAGFDLNYGWHFLEHLESLFSGDVTMAQMFASNTEEWDGVTRYGSAGTTRMRYSTNHDRAANSSPVEIYKSLEGSYAAFVIAATLGGVPMIYSSQEIGYPRKLSFFRDGAVVMDWNSGQETFNTYKKLMKLGDSITLRKGSLSRINNSDVASFTRHTDSEEILVLVNVRENASSFSISTALYNAEWKDYFTGETFRFSSKTLNAYEYKVLVKK